VRRRAQVAAGEPPRSRRVRRDAGLSATQVVRDGAPERRSDRLNVAALKHVAAALRPRHYPRMAPASASFGPHSATPAELKARLEADRHGAPYLVFREAEVTQRILPLEGVGSRFTVGRAPTADVSLWWDERVSRVHAELEHIGGDWAIVDNGLSRNGTFVNGERVSGRRRLRSGDVLCFGSTEVAFRAPLRTLRETLEALNSRPPALSEAQRRVLVALCRPCAGRIGPAAPATNREIADELLLSVEGVKTQLRALFQRFGVEDLPQNAKRARLVELALGSGAVRPHDLAP